MSQPCSENIGLPSFFHENISGMWNGSTSANASLKPNVMLGIDGSSGILRVDILDQLRAQGLQHFQLRLMPSLTAAAPGVGFTNSARITPMRMPASGLLAEALLTAATYGVADGITRDNAV